MYFLNITQKGFNGSRTGHGAAVLRAGELASYISMWQGWEILLPRPPAPHGEGQGLAKQPLLHRAVNT